MTWSRLIGACGAALCLLAGQVSAEVNGTQYRDWTLACRATAINETSCVLTQILVQAQDNRFLAEIGISMQPSKDEAGADADPVAVLVLRVPTGILLLRPPAARIDGNASDEIALVWQSCDPKFCAATATLSQEQTGQLQKGSRATMGYQRLDGAAPTIFDVSLLGITAGMAVLKKALGE